MTNKLDVAGIAIRPGVSRNKINYTKEQLKKFAPTLKGVSIQKDHDDSVDASIGLVTHSKYNSANDTVDYAGWVTDDGRGIVEKIADGRVSKVSIGAICGQLMKEEGSDTLFAENIEAAELSVVTVPGVAGTSISQSLESIQKNRQDGKTRILAVAESFDADIEETEEEIVLTEEEIAMVNQDLKQESKKEEVKESTVVMHMADGQDTCMAMEIKMIPSAEQPIPEMEKVTIKQEESTPVVEKVKDEIKVIGELVFKEEKLSEEDIKKVVVETLKELNNVDNSAEKTVEKIEVKEEVKPTEVKVEEKLEEIMEEIKVEEKIVTSTPEFKSVDVVADKKEVSGYDYCIEKMAGNKYAMFVMPDKKTGEFRSKGEE